MIATIGRNTIYTNVMLAKDGTVWWEGGEGPPPAEGSIGRAARGSRA